MIYPYGALSDRTGLSEGILALTAPFYLGYLKETTTRFRQVLASFTFVLVLSQSHPGSALAFPLPFGQQDLGR